MAFFQKKYLSIGKGQIHSWYAWFLIGLAVGFFIGVTFVASRSGEFAPTQAAPRLQPPISFAASASSETTIDLSWQDPNDNETGYAIERSLPPGPIKEGSGKEGYSFSEITRLPENTTSYTDTNLAPQTTYYYRIRAFRERKNETIHYSFFSALASTTTLPAPIIFDYNLSASGNISLQQGQSGSNTITATLIQGTTQSVSFTASGLPTGATVSFSPTSCNPTCSSTITITTQPTTPAGTYTITVSGSVLSKKTSFTLIVTAPPVGGLDQYGGYVDLPMPGGATGYWRIEKVNNVWWFVTPEGNAYWSRSVSMINKKGTGVDIYGKNYIDYTHEKYAPGRGPDDGITGNNPIIVSESRWAYYIRERLKRWGFNTIGTFSHYPATIAVNPWGTDYSYPPTGNRPKNYLPQVETYRSGGYAMSKDQTKNIFGPVYGLTSAGKFPDVFDPTFAAFVDQHVQPKLPQLPWTIYGFMDQTDEMRGTIAGHTHLGFVTAATAPVFSYDPNAPGGAKTYADPTMYTKLALRDFLKGKYVTLAAFNTAWGTSYTSWDSDGGWGVGSGFLDENGANLGPNWNRAGLDVQVKPGYPAVKTDLDAFATKIVRQWYKTVFEAFRRHQPRLLIASNNMSEVKPYVYEGLLSEDGTQTYADIIYAGKDPKASMWADRLNRPFIANAVSGTSHNDSPEGWEGKVESWVADDTAKTITITASNPNFWWAGNARLIAPGYYATEFDLPSRTGKPMQFNSQRADFLGPNKFRVKPIWYQTATYEDLRDALIVGATFRRYELGDYQSQEARGDAYFSTIREAASMRSSGGIKFIIGGNIWALHDVEWVDYYEPPRNFGLVTVRDNAYGEGEPYAQSGINLDGFERFPEWLPPHLEAEGNYGDFLTAVKEAHTNILNWHR